MHCLNAFVISSCKFICREDIFGVIIVYFKQAVIFPFFRLFRTDFLRDLNIDFFVLPYRCKINLSVARFPDIDAISSAAKLQINNVSRLEATLSAL